MKKVLALFLLMLLSREVLARELFEYNISLRARGMGGAYTAYPEETDAIFVNAASLAYVREISWEVFNVGAGINGLEAYNAFKDVSSFDSIDDYNVLYGKKLWVSGHGHSSLVIPYFGIGYFNHYSLTAALNSPPFPDFSVSYFNDSGFQLGFALPLNPLMSVGLGIKQIRRWGGEESIGITTLAGGGVSNLVDEFQNIGTGYGLDPAILVKLPGPLSPSLAVVWKDFGSTAFNQEAGTDSPPRIKENLIYAAGAQIDLPGLDLRTGAEIRHANEHDVPIGKKFHMGAELSIPFVELRAGLSQGYQSLGLGINLFFLKLDAAMYTVEMGEYPGQTPDTRLEGSLSFNMAVDADFNFTGKDGRRRKLKQRR